MQKARTHNLKGYWWSFFNRKSQRRKNRHWQKPRNLWKI